ncbi:globin [Marinimicrobium sp. C2-29]|uniref:globin n=1 Tax=Marinimicrobium sp. C2-29 TaxID=3139825 RepID=UPI00313910F1
MSYEQLFDESYERVVLETRKGQTFFEAFYQRFLASSPQVRQKFRHTDMARQRSMLKKSFYNLMAFYASGSVDSVLEHIALSHSRKGLDIAPELYDLWLDCLTATVESYDPAFDESVELAWRLVLSPGITYMKFKYDHC